MNLLLKSSSHPLQLLLIFYFKLKQMSSSCVYVTGNMFFARYFFGRDGVIIKLLKSFGQNNLWKIIRVSTKVKKKTRCNGMMWTNLEISNLVKWRKNHRRQTTSRCWTWWESIVSSSSRPSLVFDSGDGNVTLLRLDGMPSNRSYFTVSADQVLDVADGFGEAQVVEIEHVLNQVEL